MHLDRRLVALARTERGALCAAVTLAWVGGLVTVAQAWLVASIVDKAMLGGAALPELRTPLGLLAGAIVLRALLVWSTDTAAHRVAGAVVVRLRRRLLDHLFHRGPQALKGERSGELAGTLVDGIESLDAYFGDYLPQVVKAALIPATMAVFVLARDSLSALILMLTAPLIPLFLTLIGSLANARARARWTALSRLGATFLEAVQGLTTLKLLGRSRAQLETIDKASRAFADSTMEVLRIAFLSGAVLELVSTISTAVVAVAVGLRLLYGHMDFQSAFFVLLLAPEVYLPLRQLGACFHAGLAGINAARRVFELLDQPLSVGTTGAVEEVPSRPTVELDSVRFAYPGLSPDEGRRTALRGVSLRLEPGKTTALVGASGSGKSTLVHLLLRFIDPDEGTITVDGRPLGSLQPAAWRRRLAWVPQRPHLMCDTVAANIRMARPEASDEEVVEAARQVAADDVITALPDGYATVVGERGARLSGGQARLVALARAALREAPLVLVDEGTAHLDPELQERVGTALSRLLTGRAGLVVAHRLPTIEAADLIAVMANGRIVETGSHEALLARNGRYHDLVAAYRGTG